MQNAKLGVFGCSLLIAGTAIGAGMLALPVVTGPSGFIPSMCVLVVSWFFMTITGLLFAELALWLKKDVNILTMAKTTCGKAGEWITWTIYLFFFYCLLVAYLVGGGNLLIDLYGGAICPQIRIMLFAVLFVSLVIMGKSVVDPINRLFMGGLLLAYAGFVLIGAGSVELEYLSYMNWSEARWALPVAFTSFGFQGTVPTLASWMNYDRGRIYKAIIFGTLITLAVYIVWQGLFLGIVPLEGSHGLMETLQQKQDAVYPLQFFTHSALVWTFGKLFAFCALATSFLGVGIGVFDFLRDGLSLKKKSTANYIVLTVLSFGVPLFFAVVYPGVFLSALGMAGGYGSALLLGILPVIMVWRAKYVLKYEVAQKNIVGSRLVLLLLLLFVACEIITQVQSSL